MLTWAQMRPVTEISIVARKKIQALIGTNLQLLGEHIWVKANMPSGDKHPAVVKEGPLQSTRVTVQHDLRFIQPDSFEEQGK